MEDLEVKEEPQVVKDIPVAILLDLVINLLVNLMALPEAKIRTALLALKVVQAIKVYQATIQSDLAINLLVNPMVLLESQ